ncbi:EAL domain-containing protein [filamentous cyanobacterium LEGE 11480]|uniref:EAL domain-containing protein n=1 Tax=Romeriopsis navalis LEGE 11480 TaxID=2777977 RepID=A0A928Z451_9CYAN|nr:EAL domain-containing protein [Romeriopsis navalis]MBE9032206.1 EAL domain-containing protein [Romeriopsis navalis LEGE 11480]
MTWRPTTPLISSGNWRHPFGPRAIHPIISTPIAQPVIPGDGNHAAAIAQLSQQALAGLEVRALLQLAAQIVTQVLAVKVCAIWEIRANHQTLACHTIVGTIAPATSLQLQHWDWPQIRQRNTPPLHFSAPLHHCDPQTQPTHYQAESVHNLACLINGNGASAFGILEIYTPQPQVFTPADIEFLQAIAQFISTAIQRHQHDRLLHIRNASLEEIAANCALTDIFQHLCQAIETDIPDARCSIIQLDEAGQQVAMQASPRLPEYYTLDRETYPIDKLPAFYQQVLNTQSAYIWDGQLALTTADPTWDTYAAANQLQAVWVIPFCNAAKPEQVHGFLTIAHSTAASPQPQNHQLIETVAHLAAVATENHRNAHKLEKQAMYDGLTGLPNRIFFMQQLSAQLQARQEPFALLFLDVDHFKLVNDSMGHNAGDELLVEITRRLIPCIRRTDMFARLGGDEFAIMLNGVLNVGQAQSIADQIKAVLSLPFKILDREVFASVSIGIAHSDNYYASPAEILRDADIAMYRAKSLGRSRAATFDKTMHANVLDRMQIEMELRRVVDQLFLDGSSQLQLYYQPIVSLKTGKVAGFEALIRWMHPERGTISPLEFIPIAEEIGLIIPIGQWVIQEACQQLSRWQNELNIPDLSMSINVSSRQFLQADFLPMVQQILEYTGISPDCLKIEITESVLMETANTVLERLEYLRDLGVRLSLDDFGTGYSSLSYLQQFPINTLKVDRSFVNTLSEDQDQVVQAIVALTDGLAMDAVAEGIETKEQLAHLRFLGCEYGQGYFFSPPMCREQAEAMLIDKPHWPDPLSLLATAQTPATLPQAIE